MKNIKQIREGYDLITEKEEAEDRKLNALVRAGLYDAKKLPALKKALDKTADKTTPQEKRMLINLLDTLLSQVLSNQQVYMKVKQNVQHDIKEAAKPDYLSKSDPRFGNKWPSDRDIPTVLILKRKAIRVYPDNQKVALYYSQALDKYVTIPFSDVQFAVNESYVTEDDKEAAEYLDQLKKKYSKSNTNTRRNSAANMLRQGKVTSTYTYQKKDPEGNPTQGTIDYSKLNKKKEPSLSDYASKIGGPHPMIGAVGVKIHNAIKGAIGGMMRKKRLDKALAIRAANRKTTTEESQTIKSVGSVMNQSPSQSLVSENFQLRLQQIRESREQVDEGAKSFAFDDKDDLSVSSIAKDLTPGLGTARSASRTSDALKKGNYGMAALHGVDTAASLAGDLALATGVGAPATAAISAVRGGIKGAAKLGSKLLAKRAAKTVSKNAAQVAAEAGAKGAAKSVAKKPGWGRRALGAARRGLGKAGAGLAGFAAGAAGGGDSGNQSNKPSYKMDRNAGDYQFNLRAKTSDPFQDRRPSADAIASRDTQLQRKANQAILKENVIDTIKNMVKNDISESTLAYNEREITINNTVAKKLLSIYESMNRENRKKMEEMLNESATGFNKILTFAIRH